MVWRRPWVSLALSVAAALACAEEAPAPLPAAGRGAVEVVAGETGSGTVDGVGQQARFNGPAGLGIDGSRALVSDTFSATVRTVDLATGTVATVLRAPTVIEPRGITGLNGAVYFGDATCIRRRDGDDSEPVVVAGDCYAGGYLDAVGGAARFEFLLHDLEIDETRGALYTTDRLNDAVRAVDLVTGEVSTLAGGAGVGSDDGVGGAARFDGPGGLALDEAAGLLYVADTFNSTIRAIELETAVVTTVAGAAGITGSVDGPVASARLTDPQGVALVDRALVFGGFDGSVRALDLDAQTVATVARGLGGTFASPVAVPGARAILWMDLGNALLRVDIDAAPEAAVSLVAGPRAPYGFVDGDGATARFMRPTAVEVDADGQTAYLTDIDNHAVRVVDLATRTVRTLVGGPERQGDRDGTFDEARLSFPTGLALDANARVLYLADAGNQKIRAIDLDGGEVSTLAGSGTRGGRDGAAADATFADPWELARHNGALFVADSGGATVRSVDVVSGEVGTLAGSYADAGFADGIGAAARFRVPVGLAAVDGALFVADYESHTIRRVEIASGVTTTLLGTDGLAGAVGGPGDFAALSLPSGLAVSTDGALLYVAEEGGHVLREVTIADGTSRLLVGDGVRSGGLPTGVPVPIADATLLEPQDVAVAGLDLVVLSDSAVWLVRP